MAIYDVYFHNNNTDSECGNMGFKNLDDAIENAVDQVRDDEYAFIIDRENDMIVWMIYEE